MGDGPILLDDWPVGTEIMVNFDGHCGSNGQGIATCKQALRSHLICNKRNKEATLPLKNYISGDPTDPTIFFYAVTD